MHFSRLIFSIWFILLRCGCCKGKSVSVLVGWNFIASRYLYILSCFPSASAVHLIQLPMVLLGGQPRSWGMELGLCPTHLDDLWVPMQRISAKPLFFSQYTVWHLQGFSSCPLLWFPTAVLLRLLYRVSVLHSYQRWHSFLVRPAMCLLFKNNSAHNCFSYPKLKVEKARPLQSHCSLGISADCAWSMPCTNNLSSCSMWRTNDLPCTSWSKHIHLHQTHSGPKKLNMVEHLWIMKLS